MKTKKDLLRESTRELSAIDLEKYPDNVLLAFYKCRSSNPNLSGINIAKISMELQNRGIHPTIKKQNYEI